MIRYLQHSEIDKNRWDLCIDQSATPLVYGLSWYLDVVSPHWQALVWGDYEAVMPLPARKKLFYAYLSQPFFCQQSGIFSKEPLQAELIMQFLKAIPSHFRFAEIHLHEGHTDAEDALPLRKRRNYVLPVHKSFDKIQKGYSNQIKRNLKKARAASLELKPVSAQELILLYRKCKGEASYVLKQVHYDMLQLLLHTAQERKALLCKGVYSSNGALLAAGAFLVYRQRIIFLIGTANEQGREHGAMSMLMDNMIMQFAGNAQYFDFEGSEIQGIARFYKGFGAEKKPYYRYRFNHLPWYIKWLKS